MLVAKLEVWPGGNPQRAKEVGQVVIRNLDGHADDELANYDVQISKYEEPGSLWKEGQVHRFRRKKLGAWDLLFQALKVCIGYRSPDDPELPIRRRKPWKGSSRPRRRRSSRRSSTD